MSGAVRWGLTAAVVGCVVLTGCSQTAALAPVSGGRLAEVRFAALDVLVERQVPILVAPVCTGSGTGDATVTCTGQTTGRETISVSSTAADQATFEVEVGGTSIFRDAVQDVLQRAAGAS